MKVGTMLQGKMTHNRGEMVVVVSIRDLDWSIMVRPVGKMSPEFSIDPRFWEVAK